MITPENLYILKYRIKQAIERNAGSEERTLSNSDIMILKQTTQ